MHAPVRGTQSFVGVMALVWKRPALTAIEVLWRWLFWMPAFVIFLWMSGVTSENWQQHLATLDVALHGGFIFEFNPRGAVMFCGVALLLVVVWAVFFAVGRQTILRRLDDRLVAARPAAVILAVFRALALMALLGLWAFGVFRMSGLRLLTPLGGGIDPTYVPRFAGVVVWTLLLFVVWSSLSWVLQIAPVLAMGRGFGVVRSIQAALRVGALRGKLIEINFVMGIVKIALLVLTMVFSASPLPFSNVTTQNFLNWWWFGCFVFWVLLSDYFHVVRVAAYLTLFRAYEPLATPAPSPDENPAS